ELLAVAESHGASVFIDEAHSMLACGEHGRGAAEKFGVEDRVPLVYGTFSKAFGALGGFVAGSKETLQYLRFYAHPYVYSCALPPVVIAAILKALELGTKQPKLPGLIRSVPQSSATLGVTIDATTNRGAALRRRGYIQSARGRGSFRSLFLQANRILVGPVFCAAQDDARGSELAGGPLWRHCRTPLLLSQSRHQRCGDDAPCLREHTRQRGWAARAPDASGKPRGPYH